MEYECDLIAFPVINGTESDYKSCSDISGDMLLSSLCNLAHVIDEPKTEEEPFELVSVGASNSFIRISSMM